MTNARCPKCSQIIDLGDKPLQYDDGDFYVVDAICDGCGVSVQATLEVSVVVVIDDRGMA